MQRKVGMGTGQQCVNINQSVSLWKFSFCVCAASSKSEIYFMALIDVLTKYGMKKRTAQAAKTVKHGAGAEISTVRPDQYARRFLDFISKCIEWPPTSNLHFTQSLPPPTWCASLTPAMSVAAWLVTVKLIPQLVDASLVSITLSIASLATCTSLHTHTQLYGLWASQLCQKSAKHRV